jgi:hypothetical protein
MCVSATRLILSILCAAPSSNGQWSSFSCTVPALRTRYRFLLPCPNPNQHVFTWDTHIWPQSLTHPMQHRNFKTTPVSCPHSTRPYHDTRHSSSTCWDSGRRRLCWIGSACAVQAPCEFVTPTTQTLHAILCSLPAQRFIAEY